MVSSEAKISDTVTHGVYRFKIHDIFYHRSGPMTDVYKRQVLEFSCEIGGQHSTEINLCYPP